MHTKYVTIDAYVYTIHHNGDWSGDAIIQRRNLVDKSPRPFEEWTLPARLFVVLCREAVIADAVQALEELYSTKPAAGDDSLANEGKEG